MLKVNHTRMGNVAVLCLHGKIVRGETVALRRAVLTQLDADVVVLDLAGEHYRRGRPGCPVGAAPTHAVERD